MSACAWRGMGSPNLVLTTSQLLAFDRRTCISLRTLSQTPIPLIGKTVLVDFMVIEDPLDFNMLLGRDYVYAMQVVVSIDVIETSECIHLYFLCIVPQCLF